jgi:hypothetical protein
MTVRSTPPRLSIAALFFLVGAALALSLSAAPLRADAPREFRSMSISERLKLPPSTTVTLPDGRTTTVALLLDEHRARMDRIASAKELATALVFPPKHVIGSGVGHLGGDGIPIESHGVPVPGPSVATSPGLTLVPLVVPPSGAAWGGDYTAFCQQAQASLCLYVPGGVALDNAGGALLDLDYYIPEAQCPLSGGTWQTTWGGTSCNFLYPVTASVNYLPGLPPSAQISHTCKAPFFGATFDSHGFAQVNVVLPSGNAQLTPANAQSCVVKIYAPSS